MQIPSSYQTGYKEALLIDPDLAKTYIQHTLIGDPDADALINGLAGIDEKQQGVFIRAGMDLDEEKLRDAPQAVRAFFEKIGTPPAWFDSDSVYPGCRGFQAYSDLFLTSFVVDIIVQGFTTLISQSFFTTGRLTDYGVRRLKQNILHLLEIMLPGAWSDMARAGNCLSVCGWCMHRSGGIFSLLRSGTMKPTACRSVLPTSRSRPVISPGCCCGQPRELAHV